MRILTVGNMYPPHHLGGYELLWQAAVGALRAAGHDVVVLTTNHVEAGVSPADERGVFRELRWYWSDGTFPDVSRRKRRAIERHDAVVLLRHARDADLVSWWAMGGLPMQMVDRGIAWVIDAWPVYGPQVDPAGRAPGAGIDWVFCSEALRAAVKERTGLDGAVELPGVAEDFLPAPEQAWGGRLLYAGRLDERKGIATAIEALGHVESTLRVVGPGDPAPFASLAPPGRVTFEPAVPRDRLAEVYAEADAVVFPVTWFEPFGLVPLEAMATGRPVIATGTGGSGDYLRDGENALLFEPGDAAGLADCVRRLADDDLRARLRAGGLATAGELTEARWLRAVVHRHEALLR